jgi:hypothetical protein
LYVTPPEDAAAAGASAKANAKPSACVRIPRIGLSPLFSRPTG